MVDSVTLEVLRNAIAAVAEEMNATLIRTSYSPNIKDRRDCSCALFDAEARMITQAENIPVHLGAMPHSVAAAIDRFPAETLSIGDVILLNDPFYGGAHLPDLTLVTPIFVDEGLAGFAANRAHHADIGGSRPGSIAADSTEIYQEGLRIPPVKLFESDSINEGVMELILTNVRTPEERQGDLRAQHASNQTAIDRFTALFDRYGSEVMTAAMREIMEYSARRMRAALGSIPDGSYEFTDVLDDDGRGHTDLPIRVRVTIAGDEVIVDFDGTVPQVEGAINAPISVTTSATYYAVRCITDPDIPANHGCYRPITVDAPSGSIVNATSPAAVVGGNLEVSQRVVDVILGALAQEAPDRVVAAGQGTMNNVTFGGIDPRTQSPYAFYETQGGGFGGRHGKDGMDGVHVHMSNTLNTPVEVVETAYPLRVERYEYRPDTGGAGEYRGGLGLRRDIRVLNHDSTFSLLADRRHNAPYGINSGEDGTRGEDYVIRDGDPERIDGKSTFTLQSGDVVSIRTPGAGGYGDPRDRDIEAIRRDIRFEKLSEAAAEEQYGVSLEALWERE